MAGKGIQHMNARSTFKAFCLLLLAGLGSAIFAAAQARDIPKHGTAVVLFDGKDLSQFDTFLPSTGLNSDPNHVFTVEHGTVHVSGTEMGYFVTRQEYRNYYLRAEFKWGEGTFAPRVGQARNSGILYNIQGPNKVWPRSIEFQINEGCNGGFWMTDGAALTAEDGVACQTGRKLQEDRPLQQGRIQERHRVSRPHQRIGKTARRMECR